MRNFSRTDIKIIRYLGLKNRSETEREIRKGIKHKFQLHPHLNRLEEEGTIRIPNTGIPQEFKLTQYGRDYFRTFKRLKRVIDSYLKG